jgi:hypothetical protein
MNEDSVDNSAQPQLPVIEPVEPHTNYSRWMTDMAAEIAGLTLHQLAIPGAHNSGVDMAGTWGVEELLAACQNKSFPFQFAAGARYLDLRLEDKSYWKMVGNFAPQRVFVEAFEFTHGNDSYWISNVSAGRTLQYLIAEAKKFAENNPGEIIILDIRHFKNRLSEGLERAFAHLTPIKYMLIPTSAANLTLDTIRKTHPGRNIILCFDHGEPEDWKREWVQKPYLWSSFKHVWNAIDDEQSVTETVISTMLSPPSEKYWVLSAAARNKNGPMYLRANHPIRTETFRNGRQTANVVMVDFIERAETITSVTEQCIALNRLRSHDVKPPTTPQNLKARKVPGDNLQNTVEVSLDRSDDGIGIRTYEIYEGDNLLFTTSNIPHQEKNLPLRNYILRARAVNVNGKKSEFSAPYTFIQDEVPPSVPTGFTAWKYGFTAIELHWNASYDQAGIQHYEVSRENQAPIITSELTAGFTQLNPNQPYTFKLRAKDVNGLFSEYTELIYKPINPTFENPKLHILKSPDASGYYEGMITWDLIDAPSFTFHYEYNNSGIPTVGFHLNGKPPFQVFRGRLNVEKTITARAFFYYTEERGELSTTTFSYAGEYVIPPRNLKVQSRTPDRTVITWVGSFTPNVESYALSLNERSPVILPREARSYEFEGLPGHERFSLEIWAINNFDEQSETRSLIIEPIPGYVAPPKNFRYTQPLLPTLDWDAPEQPVSGYNVTLTGPAGNSVIYGVTVPRLQTFLLPRTRHDVSITAKTAEGESLPLIGEFTTL